MRLFECVMSCIHVFHCVIVDELLCSGPLLLDGIYVATFYMLNLCVWTTVGNYTRFFVGLHSIQFW